MLIIKAFINNKQIDEIHIHNAGNWFGYCYKYKVKVPKNIKRNFIHNRTKGWKELAKQVLQHLISLDQTDKTKEG